MHCLTVLKINQADSMSKKGGRRDISGTGSEIKSGKCGSYAWSGQICDYDSSPATEESRPRFLSYDHCSAKSKYQSNGNNSSDERTHTHRPRHKIKYKLRDDNRYINSIRRSERSRQKADSSSIADSDSSELESKQHPLCKYESNIWNLESCESDRDYEESRHQDQKRIPLQKQKLARSISSDNISYEDNISSQDRKISQTTVKRQGGVIHKRRSNDNLCKGHDTSSDDAASSQTTIKVYKRRKGSLILIRKSSNNICKADDVSSDNTSSSQTTIRYKGRVIHIRSDHDICKEDHASSSRSSISSKSIAIPESDYKESRHRDLKRIPLQQQKQAGRRSSYNISDKDNISPQDKKLSQTTIRYKGRDIHIKNNDNICKEDHASSSRSSKRSKSVGIPKSDYKESHYRDLKWIPLQHQKLARRRSSYNISDKDNISPQDKKLSQTTIRYKGRDIHIRNNDNICKEDHASSSPSSKRSKSVAIPKSDYKESHHLDLKRIPLQQQKPARRKSSYNISDKDNISPQDKKLSDTMVKRKGDVIYKRRSNDKLCKRHDISSDDAASSQATTKLQYKRRKGSNIHIKKSSNNMCKADNISSDNASSSQTTISRKAHAIHTRRRKDNICIKKDPAPASGTSIRCKSVDIPKSDDNLSDEDDLSGDDEKPLGDTRNESDEDKMESEPVRRKWWQIRRKYIFGLGHVFNDLCAAMWFSYMMLFFEAVLQMRATFSGYMMMLGQVVDAFSTPAVGVAVDKFMTKKKWHLIGTILIIVSFPLLFIKCIGCSETADGMFIPWWTPLYYAGFIIIFQIGWAIVQISHLAMIPDISKNSAERAELTSIRTMASMASSLTVYLVTWMVLKVSKTFVITPADGYKFQNIVLIISGIGTATAILFHFCFKLKSKKGDKSMEAGDVSTGATRDKPKVKFIHFLKMPDLYFTSLLYVFSRLYWALSLVYIPMFLEERMVKDKTAGSDLVASVPMVVYISSFIFSLLLNKVVHLMGNQIAFLVGSIISIIGCIWIAILIKPHANIVHIFLVAVLIGAGSAITQVASLSIAADLIGSHAQQSAAVYSIVTFADKLITGLAVVVIENFKCAKRSECPNYYKGVLSYVCGGCAVLGILVLGLQVLSFKRKRKSKHNKKRGK